MRGKPLIELIITGDEDGERLLTAAPSAASKPGLQKGDLITQINNIPIRLLRYEQILQRVGVGPPWRIG